MPVKRRTRPNGKSPVRTVEKMLNEPFPGCCKPFPDATFKNQTLVKLEARHTGKYCKGYVAPLSIEDWKADVDARATPGSFNWGDD